MSDEIKGTLRIGRVSSSVEGQFVAVELSDEKSRLRFAEARISFEDLARTLMSHSEVPCEITLRGLDKIGREREHRMEQIVMEGDDYWRDKGAKVRIAAEARRAEMGDDWSYRESDLTNTHRRSKNAEGKTVVSVNFERWKPLEQS